MGMDGKECVMKKYNQIQDVIDLSGVPQCASLVHNSLRAIVINDHLQLFL